MAPIVLQTQSAQATILPRVPNETTQTITRQSTSFTTAFLLSPSTASSLSAVRVASVESITSPVADINPRSTTAPLNIAETTGLSSGAIVGIVFGSILGFLVLLVLGYKCCVNSRSAVWFARYDGDEDGIVYGDRRDGGGGQGRIWKSGARGGGGEDWEMRSEYGDGDGVRRPDKAVLREGRRERDRRSRRKRRERGRKWNDDDGYDRRNRSRRLERGENRRRSRSAWVVVERRGILGWGRPVRSSRGRSLRRDTRRKIREFGSPVRSWRGSRRNRKGDRKRRMGLDGYGGGGDKELRFDVRD